MTHQSLSCSRGTILVTGGAGYIGSHTCKALSNAGYHPVVLDSLYTGKKENVKWGKLEIGDIRDLGWVESVFQKHKPEGIIHFAALISVEDSMLDPIKYYDVNVTGSLNVIRAAYNSNVTSFIFSSSCAVYKNTEETPVNEDHPINPVSPYADTKHVIERVLQYSKTTHNINYGILRYFNVAGCDPEGDLGFNGSFGLIPIIVDKIKKEETISIFGNDYNTKDNTCIRDFIHVNDVANAHVQALDYILQYKEPFILNIGSEKGYSVKEVIETASRILKRDVVFQYGPRRNGDIEQIVADSQKAQSLLKWKPKYSLEDMIKTSYLWSLKNTP